VGVGTEFVIGGEIADIERAAAGLSGRREMPARVNHVAGPVQERGGRPNHRPCAVGGLVHFTSASENVVAESFEVVRLPD